jgi:DNA-directed RNA polymerase specialized sigma24 family protein
MNSFITNTDWVHNKHNQAIVYRHADGMEIITLERFLADSPKNTADEDDAMREQGESELPIYDWSEQCSTPSLEEQIFGDGCAGERQAYLKRREQLITLLPIVMDKLTPTQLRRLRLHREDGLTTRKIAELEGCTHQSVVECLRAADKKIIKILAKS